MVQQATNTQSKQATQRARQTDRCIVITNMVLFAASKQTNKNLRCGNRKGLLDPAVSDLCACPHSILFTTLLHGVAPPGRYMYMVNPNEALQCAQKGQVAHVTTMV